MPTSGDTEQSTKDVDPKSSQKAGTEEKLGSAELKETIQDSGSSSKATLQSTDLSTNPPPKGQEQVQEQVQEQEQKAKQEDKGKTDKKAGEGTDSKAGQAGKKDGTTEDEASKTKKDSPPAKPEGPQASQPQADQPQVVQPQAPGQPASGAKARLPAGPKLEFMHVLKQIKNGKVKMNLVKYGNELNLIDERACSRVYAVNPEKKSECEEFCVNKWNECKDSEVPGYCLADLYNSNNCYFCFV